MPYLVRPPPPISSSTYVLDEIHSGYLKFLGRWGWELQECTDSEAESHMAQNKGQTNGKNHWQTLWRDEAIRRYDEPGLHKKQLEKTLQDKRMGEAGASQVDAQTGDGDDESKDGRKGFLFRVKSSFGVRSGKEKDSVKGKGKAENTWVEDRINHLADLQKTWKDMP